MDRSAPAPAERDEGRPRDGPLLFALEGSRILGEAVAARLGTTLAAHEEREFEDGEHKSRPLQSVRGRDAYVLHSLHGGARGPDERLLRLLFFLGTLRDAGAARLTALVPYLAFSRKERRTQPRDPVTTRYVAALLEAVGTDRVVTLDVHSPAGFENAFRCRAESLEAAPLFVAQLAPELLAEHGPLVVLSPDAGGVKRAERLRVLLERRLGRPAGSAFVVKHRALGIVSGDAVVGDVDGATVLVVDDLVATGGTLARAARACRTRGAKRFLALATHGVFAAGAEEALAEPALERLVVTNTIEPLDLPPGPARERLVVLDVAPLLAAAVRAGHEGRSLEALLGP